MTHVRVRGEVEHRVASHERPPQEVVVEDVAVHELDAVPRAGPARNSRRPAGQVVVDDDRDPLGAQPIGERAPDEPGAPVMSAFLT